MKELPVILGVILVFGYCALIWIKPHRLERDRQALAEIRARAEAVIQAGDAVLQPIVDDLIP